MAYYPPISVVWVVQRKSTGKIIQVCRRMKDARDMVSKDSSLKSTRKEIR